MSTVSQHAVDVFSLPLSSGQILCEMGYGKVDPKEEFAGWVDALLDECRKIALPSFAFRLMEGEALDEELLLADGSRFHVGPILGRLLKGSGQFALFTATVGSAFQNWKKEQDGQDDILRSFIVDVLGTCLVETVGDRMERVLEQEILPLRHTRRFSPGYCGWPLMEQRKLFALLGGEPCGIRLSDVCLMTPEKSISGVIGIGERVNEKTYGCRYCELETCYKRKKRK